MVVGKICNKLKDGIGQLCIRVGIKLATSSDRPNIIIHSYKTTIEDQRITKFPGHIIIYDCSKTKVIIQNDDLIVGI